MSSNSKAWIFGCYKGKDDSLILTPTAAEYNQGVDGKLLQKLKQSSFSGDVRKTRVFSDLEKDNSCVIVTGLGLKSQELCQIEEIDSNKENVRIAIAEATRLCQDYNVTSVYVDDCSEPQSAGEILPIANYFPGQWKTKKNHKDFDFHLISKDDSHMKAFQVGLIYGKAQVYAAKLSETPANMKSPATISKYISDQMPSNVVCTIRDKNWIQSMKMGLFLSVNQGSAEPPVLLEAHYEGSKDAPVILVGKGITFDSGGISIKPSAAMGEMKADMTGAAVVFATVKALAELKIPIHVIGIAPFTDNMPSGSATHPGDIHTGMNGKTVEIDNTDAEGRLVLADALTYAETLKPREIIDLATLTGAVIIALGSSTNAIYSTNNQIIENFKKAAVVTGDRVWKMPLYEAYLKLLESNVADLSNSSKKRMAGSCSAAIFLKEFVTTKNWAHIDIAGTMINDGEISYLPKGMTGRPVRTLIEYLKSKSQEK